MRELPTTRINTIFVCAKARVTAFFLLDPGAPNFVVRNLPKNVSIASCLALGYMYASNKNIGGKLLNKWWLGSSKFCIQMQLIFLGRIVICFSLN